MALSDCVLHQDRRNTTFPTQAFVEERLGGWQCPVFHLTSLILPKEPVPQSPAGWLFHTHGCWLTPVLEYFLSDPTKASRGRAATASSFASRKSAWWAAVACLHPADGYHPPDPQPKPPVMPASCLESSNSQVLLTPPCGHEAIHHSRDKLPVT